MSRRRKGCRPVAAAGRRARDAAARHPRRPCRGRPRPRARSRHLPDDRPGGGLFEREERLLPDRDAAVQPGARLQDPGRRGDDRARPRRPRRSTGAGPRARPAPSGSTRSARCRDEARAAWLGHAVARTLEASLNLAGERACAFHDHLGRLLGIDVARWWRPTGANYFDRVPKSVTLAALGRGRRRRARGPLCQGEEGRACPGLRADLLGRLHRRGRGQGGGAWPGCPTRCGSRRRRSRQTDADDVPARRG